MTGFVVQGHIYSPSCHVRPACCCFITKKDAFRSSAETWGRVHVDLLFRNVPVPCKVQTSGRSTWPAPPCPAAWPEWVRTSPSLCWASTGHTSPETHTNTHTLGWSAAFHISCWQADFSTQQRVTDAIITIANHITAGPHYHYRCGLHCERQPPRQEQTNKRDGEHEASR